MEDVKLYREFNLFQQVDAEETFREFLKFSQNENFDFETILDVGCGPGDTLVRRILPQLQKKPTKVVGVDISRKMVESAAQQYQSNILKFQVLDIQSDSYEPTGHLANGSYDLITSFYCYNWVRNERQALTNIYNLMKPGGSFVLLFIVHHCFIDVTVELSQEEKYKNYVETNQFVTQYYFEKDPVEVLSRRLREAGFRLQQVGLRSKEFRFENLGHIKNHFKAVHPFKMPEEIANDFNRECALRIAENCLRSQNECESGFVEQYEVLVSFVVKDL